MCQCTTDVFAVTCCFSDIKTHHPALWLWHWHDFILLPNPTAIPTVLSTTCFLLCHASDIACVMIITVTILSCLYVLHSVYCYLFVLIYILCPSLCFSGALVVSLTWCLFICVLICSLNGACLCVISTAVCDITLSFGSGRLMDICDEMCFAASELL